MKAKTLAQGQDLQVKSLFTTPEKIQQFRVDLEKSTEEAFKEIDRAKSKSIDESCKKYLD